MAPYRYHGPPVSTSGSFNPQKALSIWLKYIDAIDWTPGELDHQEFAAFSKAAFHGIDQDTAFNLVLDKMKRSGARNLRTSKIRHSLLRAYGAGGDGLCRSAPPLQLPPIEPYSEERLRDAVGDLAQKVDETFFVERSEFTTWNRSPAGVLHKLSFPGECAWVTANDTSSNGCLWRNDGINNCSARWISITGEPGGQELFEPNFACLSFFARNQPNVWFLNNPITGTPHFDARLSNGQSYRCIETVSSWRFLVLETDVAPPGLWLALLAMAPIRIAAVYHSGGRGHHGLVRIDAASKLEADDICEFYKREYVPLGACSGTLSAFRLTRLPNCFRGQTGQLQRLIYLNSNPTGTPIKDQPVLRKVPHQDANGSGT
jgi:hypothetical protein